MLLGTLGAILLGNLLTGRGVNKKGKGTVRAGKGAKKSKRQGEGIVRAGWLWSSFILCFTSSLF